MSRYLAGLVTGFLIGVMFSILVIAVATAAAEADERARNAWRRHRAGRVPSRPEDWS